MSPQDDIYIQRTLQLAQLGTRAIVTNPMVGCVIVKNGKIIGEGWHQKYGEAHAEVNAVNSVKNKKDIEGSTVYVSLEPCSHHGKTPPCADLLVSLKPAKVVICNVDSNPLVGGKGIEKLRNANIQVESGILEEEGRVVNKRFFTFVEQKRPYIILKWAQTADGFIARENYDSKWISNPLARKWVHRWRARENAIMVGTNTAQHDNPQLTVRDWFGESPTRVVIDKYLRLSPSLKIFDSQAPTLCYNLKKNEQTGNTYFIQIPEAHFLQNLFQDLYQRKLPSILVEGGTQLLQSLIAQNLWDEARIFQSQSTFQTGISAPKITGDLVDQRTVGDNLYFEWRNQ